MRGIYIHIPFCIKKCAYCDFLSFGSSDAHMLQYTDALKREIRAVAKKHVGYMPDTVFVGGGTPSILPNGIIASIIQTVFECFNMKSCIEITIESNPGTLSAQKLDEYLCCGINRLSIGLQSANDRLLALIGRIHTLADFQDSIRMAKDVGFTNINADMMYGLPTQTVNDIKQTAEMLIYNELTHISAYSLILESGTQMFERVAQGALTMPNEEAEYNMHRCVIDTLSKAGYNRYEISNYARNGNECKHNLIYWDLGEYIGIGLGAHSAIHIDGQWTRYANTDSMNEYLSRIDSYNTPIKNSDAISKTEEMFEFIMLGLRKTCGVRLCDFSERFMCELSTVYGNAIHKLIANDLAIIAEGRFYLSERGLDIQNMVLAEFE